MNKIIISLLTVVSLISCDSKIEKPDPFLEHDQMVNIITDLSLAEGTRIYARASHLERKEGEYSINDYYAMVFEKYSITQAELDSINSWYINYPEENQAIFKEVLDRLNKLQAEERAITKTEEKKRIDKMKVKKEKARALADSIKLDSTDVKKHSLEKTLN